MNDVMEQIKTLSATLDEETTRSWKQGGHQRRLVVR